MLKDNSFPVLGKSSTENACQHLSGGRFVMRPGTEVNKDWKIHFTQATELSLYNNIQHFLRFMHTS